MPKQNQQTEAEIRKMISFAEHLRTKIIIPSMELENFLNFQYSEILKKNIFNCCTVQKIYINKAFKRAFRTMNRTQQAQYYSKCVKIVLKQIYSTNQKVDEIENIDQETNTDNDPNPAKKFERLTVLIKKQGSFKKWIQSKIQLASQICVLRILQTGQELDLHHYVMRQSNSKKRPSFVLESIEQLAHPTTVRISNYYESFGELKHKLQFYLDKGLRQKIISLLKRHRASLSTSFRSSIMPQITIPQRQKNFKKKETPGKQGPATLLLTEGNKAKSMRKIILECSKMSFSDYQCKKIYSNLVSHQKIFSLSSSKDFDEVSKGVFYNKKTHVTRRVFRFEESEMNYEWLVTAMNCYKIFKKWKSCLFLINLLAQFPEEKTKIYHEINLYKDYNEVDYVYLRHLFDIDGINYYIDKSINTEEYGRVANGSRGWIEECLWRFRKIGSSIQVLVQVQFGGNYNKKNALQLGIQYIGQVGELKKEYFQDQRLKTSTFKTVHNYNLFLFEDESELNRTSSQNYSPFKKKRNQVLHSKTQLSNKQIKIDQDKKQHQEGNQEVEQVQLPSFQDCQDIQKQWAEQQNVRDDQSQFLQTQFYSIDEYKSDSDSDKVDINDEQNQRLTQPQIKQPVQVNQNQQKVKFYSQCLINQSEESSSAQKQEQRCISISNYPEDAKYLFVPHIVECKQKDKSIKPRQSTEQKGHYLWRKQWKITDKGQLININEEQIKVQSSVLKLVIKRMGRNILSGKSVLNISLPIQIFGTDSNLQRLCKSVAYGPRFLQAATKLQDPVQRMKRVICFALGFGLCYIEMQKPFNPILGQTYQGVIDGCPVYGQQISHHPPISTILFKGRGYTVYANLQAKVQMGLNSASGINDGLVNISFSQNNFNQNLIKFTCPPGQISGLVMGDRKLTLIKKTYYIDEKNMILAIIQWGSQKKKNQISFNNDYLEGQIVKLKPNTDLSKLDKIKETQFQKICSSIKGRWTGKLTFDNQVLFDVQTDGPYFVEQYPYPLESNVHFREDIILRKNSNWVLAQQAKQRLEELQRNDRKLRKQYEK